MNGLNGSCSVASLIKRLHEAVAAKWLVVTPNYLENTEGEGTRQAGEDTNQSNQEVLVNLLEGF